MLILLRNISNKEEQGSMKFKLATALAVGVVTIFISAPTASALSSQTNGDPELITKVQTALGSEFRENVSAAYIDTTTDTVKYANFGSDTQTQYEIGSLTKGFTGLLLGQAIEQGEVTAGKRVGQILPIGLMYPAYGLTLRELATHTSGLPTRSITADSLTALANFNTQGTDPYAFGMQNLLNHARASFYMPTRGQHQYSNMGYALLGQALGQAAGSTYKQILQDRLLTPLGMNDTILPETVENLPTGAPTGKAANGTPKAAWTMYSYAPAGGMRTDISDMAIYAERLAEGTVPGENTAIASPIYNYGYGLGVGNLNGDTYLSHTGQSGGFASIMFVNKTKGKALVVLTNTASAWTPGTTGAPAILDVLHSYGG